MTKATEAQGAGFTANAVGEAFLREVWEALKGDHNDLRKEQIILRAFREAVRTASPALYEAAEDSDSTYDAVLAVCRHDPRFNALCMIVEESQRKARAALAAASPSQTGGK